MFGRKERKIVVPPIRSEAEREKDKRVYEKIEKITWSDPGRFPETNIPAEAVDITLNLYRQFGEEDLDRLIELGIKGVDDVYDLHEACDGNLETMHKSLGNGSAVSRLRRQRDSFRKAQADKHRRGNEGLRRHLGRLSGDK